MKTTQEEADVRRTEVESMVLLFTTLVYRNNSVLDEMSRILRCKAVLPCLKDRLAQCNALNLDRHVLRQLLDSHTATRRLVGKVLFVHTVHLRKVGHVGDEDGRLRRSQSINIHHHAEGSTINAIPASHKRLGVVGLTLTTLLRLLPASSRMALTLSQHAAVCSAMLP